MRNIAGLGHFVEPVELLARDVAMLGQVEVAASGDALELLHAEGELEHDVRGTLRIVGELLGRVRVEGELGARDTDGFEPSQAAFDPILVGGGPIGSWRDKVFDLHLLELTGAEDEVARIDFVAESLTDLGDAEGQLHAACVDDVLEVDEDALGGLRTEIGGGRRVLHGADVSLEHHVERAGRRERTRLAGGRRRDERMLFGRGLGVIL